MARWLTPASHRFGSRALTRATCPQHEVRYVRTIAQPIRRLPDTRSGNSRSAAVVDSPRPGITPLPEYARNLSVSVVRMAGQRDASLAILHEALALLHGVTLERDLLRDDRNRLVDELRQLRQQIGKVGVRRSEREHAA